MTAGAYAGAVTDTVEAPADPAAATQRELPHDPATAPDAEARQSRRGGWKLMREVAGANKRWTVIGISASLFWTLAKIVIPLLALGAIDEGIDPYDGQALAFWSGLIVLATAIVGGMSYLRRYSAFAISLKAEAELRRRLFDHLQRLHFGYHDRAQIGELMARVSTDAKQVQLLLVFIPIFGANILMIVGVSIVLFALNASSPQLRSRRCRCCSSARGDSPACCTRSRWDSSSVWPRSPTWWRRASPASGS